MQNNLIAAANPPSGKQPPKNVIAFSVALCFVAGYCDTATFITGKHLLSSHAAANLFLFALDLYQLHRMQAGVKLVSIPVFMTGVAGGRYLLARFRRTYLLLLAEGAVLALTAVLFFRFPFAHTPAGNWLTLLIVLAMGMQSALFSFPAAKVSGSSRVWSAGMLQAALIPFILLSVRCGAEMATRFYRAALMLAGLITGCMVSGSVSTHKGLSGIILPAIVVLSAAYYDWQAQQATGPDQPDQTGIPGLPA